MQMTIKQLADELGVSKTTINRAVVKLGWKDKILKFSKWGTDIFFPKHKSFKSKRKY